MRRKTYDVHVHWVPKDGLQTETVYARGHVRRENLFPNMGLKERFDSIHEFDMSYDDLHQTQQRNVRFSSALVWVTIPCR